MTLWKRAGYQTKSKALEKSIVERIVQEPVLGEKELVLPSVGEE